jgi:hypothetical protein
MAYHDDLIQHAILLSELNISEEPKQVDLRRAVSAAYYGLFHLLTTEAAQNWKHESQRDRFARMFDHGRMKTCSSRISSRPLPVDPAEIPIAADLKLVAGFIRQTSAGSTYCRLRQLKGMVAHAGLGCHSTGSDGNQMTRSVDDPDIC